MKNNLRQIELILYRLKREFGLPITLRRPIKNESDVQTGKIVRDYESFNIGRAIRLPADQLRTFIYDLTYVAANKNFAYGGLFDKTMKIFIIDRKDLKKDGIKIAIDNSWHIVCQQRKYDIADTQETEDGNGYMIKGKMLDSTPIILDP